MSNKLSIHEITFAIDLVEKHLRLGAKPPKHSGVGPSAIEEACKESVAEGQCVSRKCLRNRLQIGKEMGLEPDWSLYTPPQYTRPKAVQGLSTPCPPNPAIYIPNGERVIVCVIPDAHDSPLIPDKSRFLWIGRWIAACEPDYVVSIGDFVTLDSLSTHHDLGSLTARGHPSFNDDLNSLNNALNAVESGMQGFHCRKLLVKGNHEYRAERFEDRNPNLAGTVVKELDNEFTSFKWRLHRYGEFVYIGGVGFIHCAFGHSGRPYGGKSGMHRAANDSVFSFVQGHSHLRERVDCPKIGPNHYVTAMSVGCALPYGYIEEYALHSTTGWWWGVVKLVICDGLIIDEDWTSMLTLEQNYGDGR